MKITREEKRLSAVLNTGKSTSRVRKPLRKFRFFLFFSYFCPNFAFFLPIRKEPNGICTRLEQDLPILESFSSCYLSCIYQFWLSSTSTSKSLQVFRYIFNYQYLKTFLYFQNQDVKCESCTSILDH